jgi:hypothetical protein
MDDLISYCGYDCKKCPAYNKNIKTPQDQKIISENWFKYCGGDYIEPARINCDGCKKADNQNPKRVSKNCKFRGCAIEKNITNCSFCNNCICENLKKQMQEFEKVSKLFKNSIPAEEYNKWFLPYDSRKNFKLTGEND